MSTEDAKKDLRAKMKAAKLRCKSVTSKTFDQEPSEQQRQVIDRFYRSGQCTTRCANNLNPEEYLRYKALKPQQRQKPHIGLTKTIPPRPITVLDNMTNQPRAMFQMSSST